MTKIKILWALAALAVGYFLLKKKGGTITTGNTMPAQHGAAIQAIIATQDPGNGAWYDTDPKNYKAVTDPGYEDGWYRSKLDGSWYNVKTGDFYSSGSSPARYNQMGKYTTGEIQRIHIDTNAPPTFASNNADPEETKRLGYDVVY